MNVFSLVLGAGGQQASAKSSIWLFGSMMTEAVEQARQKGVQNEAIWLELHSYLDIACTQCTCLRTSGKFDKATLTAEAAVEVLRHLIRLLRENRRTTLWTTSVALQGSVSTLKALLPGRETPAPVTVSRTSRLAVYAMPTVG